MTNEAMNVAVAEACGWTHVDADSMYDSGCSGKHPDIKAPHNHTFGCPSYATDLNAMHEAEATLVTVGKWIEYTEQLAKLTLINSTVWETCVAYHNNDVRAAWHNMAFLVNATARQRAEAFLRTVGKWTEVAT